MTTPAPLGLGTLLAALAAILAAAFGSVLGVSAGHPHPNGWGGLVFGFFLVPTGAVLGMVCALRWTRSVHSPWTRMLHAAAFAVLLSFFWGWVGTRVGLVLDRPTALPPELLARGKFGNGVVLSEDDVSRLYMLADRKGLGPGMAMEPADVSSPELQLFRAWQQRRHGPSDSALSTDQQLQDGDEFRERLLAYTSEALPRGTPVRGLHQAELAAVYEVALRRFAAELKVDLVIPPQPPASAPDSRQGRPCIAACDQN